VAQTEVTGGAAAQGGAHARVEAMLARDRCGGLHGAGGTGLGARGGAPFPPLPSTAARGGVRGPGGRLSSRTCPC